MAASMLASVIGSRSIRTRSWRTGAVVMTFCVTTRLRSRARPGLHPLSADPRPLLRAGHRTVGGRTVGVVFDGTVVNAVVYAVAGSVASPGHAGAEGGGCVICVAEPQRRLPPMAPGSRPGWSERSHRRPWSAPSES